MIGPFSGGCACGAVRYECSAEPLAMLANKITNQRTLGLQ